MKTIVARSARVSLCMTYIAFLIGLSSYVDHIERSFLYANKAKRSPFHACSMQISQYKVLLSSFLLLLVFLLASSSTFRKWNVFPLMCLQYSLRYLILVYLWHKTEPLKLRWWLLKGSLSEMKEKKKSFFVFFSFFSLVKNMQPQRNYEESRCFRWLNKKCIRPCQQNHCKLPLKWISCSCTFFFEKSTRKAATQLFSLTDFSRQNQRSAN